MSTSSFNIGQRVHITTPYGHFQPSNDTVYHIGQINRIMGSISVQLLQDGKSVGALPESNLKAAK